jgi:ABC-2 type transport system ATP-binding protein
VISVRGLRKHYEVHQRAPGLRAALGSLFRRTYKTVRAVDGIDFEIGAGERVGFLGPNGAGKTTTLKVLAGLLHPTEGEVRVDGHEPRRREEAFLRRITLVLGQKQQLLWDLPPSETFELNRAVYGVPRATFEKETKAIIELLEIGDVIKRPTRQLSLGERMKCELCAALVHGPRLLFLDEPTIGLDVGMQAALRDFIRRYNEEHGATILLTSHNMADVSSLCPRVILVDRGKLAFDGSLEDLVRRTRPEKRVVLRFSTAPEAGAVEALALGTVVRVDDASAVLQVPQSEVSRVVARALASLPVHDLDVVDPPLEEIMADVFGRHASARELPEDEAAS